jgi:type I restriction enzyme S subunit
MSVEGWKNNSLISLLKILKSGGTPNTSQSNFYGGDIPFVAIEDMSASRKYLCSTVKSLTKEGIKNSNAWLVPQNSLLYSIYATLGLVRINTIPVATNQAILAMIVNDEMVDQDYLYYWLEYIRDSVVNLSAQTTQSNLSATTVKPFVVQHPQNKQEQTQIATILSTIDRAIEQTEALIAKQQRIKT